ncbi:ABC transporter ATP-binding protein [Spirochaetia bacterium]|nr:ABC transporter ATP-binding protein [Spirochaetia bacterium]
MIKVQNLTKKYGTVEALHHVSFEIGAEQVVGFLGPNGAGKTTIMKILTGFHFPSSGSVTIDGIDVQENPVATKSKIGYLPESVPLYGDFKVREYLSFIAEARGVEKKDRNNAIGAALESCGLSGVAGKRIETLSKGYKQRTGLAQAMLHDPPILILDEPTTGLDPNQIIEIRSLIKTLGTRKTVLLSTHILPEVAAVCSSVLIINAGRLLAQGTPEEIASGMRESEIWDLTLKQANPDMIAAQCERLGAAILSSELLSGASLQISLSVPGDGQAIFEWAVREGLIIIGMKRKTINLEDIFVRLTHEEQPE